MTKDSVPQKDIAIINIYTANKRAPKYMKKKLIELKGEIDISTKLTADFIIPLSIMNRL
jgi:hypothetical protein